MAYLREAEPEFALEMSGQRFAPEAAAAYMDAPVTGNKGGRPRNDDILFTKVGGTLGGILGVDNVTRKTWNQLWEGKWEGFDPCKRGARKSKIDPSITETNVRNTGYDVYFSYIKDLDLYLVGCKDPAKRARIVAGLERAADVAMQSVQEDAVLARLKTGERAPTGMRLNLDGTISKMDGGETERTAGAEMMWVGTSQWTARATAESIKRGYRNDISLHQHRFLFTMALVRDEEHPSGYRTTTLDSLGLKRHAGERDNVYMAEAARVLEDEGLELEYSFGRNGKVETHIKGFSQAANDFFSTNSDQAKVLSRKMELRLGRPPRPHELRDEMWQLRLQKDEAAKELDGSLHQNVYLNALASHGLNVGDFDYDAKPKGRPSQEESDAILESRLDDPQHGLTMQRTLVSNAEVRREIARCNVGVNYTRDELKAFKERYLQKLERIPVGDSGEVLYASKAHVAREVELELALLARLEERRPAIPRQLLDEVIARQPRSLDDNQRDAVYKLASDKALSMLVGPAGAGKTTTLLPLVQAFRAHQQSLGYRARVNVLAYSNDVAVRTGQGLQADWSSSVESFGIELERRMAPMTEHDLIIIDEAAALDNERMRALMADAGKAAIWFVGDPEQLAAIGPSGWWQRLARIIDPSQLEQVYRHKNADDLAAFTAMRSGDVDLAVQDLFDRGRFHISEDEYAVVSAAMDYYLELRKDGIQSDQIRIIIDSANRSIDVMNRFVQDRLKKEFALTGAGFEVKQGDQNRHWTLHQGDQVVFLKKYFLARGQRAIRNGEKAVIEHLNDDGLAQVRMGTGELLQVQLQRELHHQPVGLAYAQHTAKFQGGEVDEVIYIPGAEGATNKNSAYSSLTREKDRVQVFLNKVTHGEDPIAEIARIWKKSAVQTPLLDYLERFEPSRYEQYLGRKARLSAAMPVVVGTASALRKERWTKVLQTVATAAQIAEFFDHPAYRQVDGQLLALDRLGKDSEETLRVAFRSRDFGDATDITRVMHHRLKGYVQAAERDALTRQTPTNSDNTSRIPSPRSATSNDGHHLDLPTAANS